MKIKGKVFIIDDDRLIISTLSRVLKRDSYIVYSETDTDDIINKVQSKSPDVVLLDITLPERNGLDILQEMIREGLSAQIIMLTADDSAETAVKAMKLGAADYLTKPFNGEEVKIVISSAIEKANLKQEVDYLRKAYDKSFEKNLIGESDAIKELIVNMNKIAQAGVPSILVTGDNGTGKEVVARSIHNMMYGSSKSGYAPFIGINCAAMPESMLESELFGHNKGAFTDAKSDKKGLFEMADGGTILLDEIGEMRPDLQTKLLRVLEEWTIRRIGGQEDIPIDLTVIATTNRNLSEAVKLGDFRQDLFFRLSIFYLHVVPLRERKEDIQLLAKHFLNHFSMKYNKKNIQGFSRESEKLLLSYSWPGNVRELRNLIERLVVLENTEVLMPEHLPKWLLDQSLATLKPDRTSDDRFLFPEFPDTGISLDEVEKNLISQALKKAGNNRRIAAKLLDIRYDKLRYQIKKYGID